MPAKVYTQKEAKVTAIKKKMKKSMFKPTYLFQFLARKSAFIKVLKYQYKNNIDD